VKNVPDEDLKTGPIRKEPFLDIDPDVEFLAFKVIIILQFCDGHMAEF
jgi:hypothetical protein